MLRAVSAVIWLLGSLAYWAIAILAAGFAGLPAAIAVVAIAALIWLPATALLTDRLGLTRLWPHNR